MTNLKIISVRVSTNDDYADVTEITKGATANHKLGIRGTAKRNLPFVLLQQTLPPYTKIRVRLDKLGLSEDKETGLYEFYYKE